MCYFFRRQPKVDGEAIESRFSGGSFADKRRGHLQIERWPVVDEDSAIAVKDDAAVMRDPHVLHEVALALARQLVAAHDLQVVEPHRHDDKGEHDDGHRQAQAWSETADWVTPSAFGGQRHDSDVRVSGASFFSSAPKNGEATIPRTAVARALGNNTAVAQLAKPTLPRNP